MSKKGLFPLYLLFALFFAAALFNLYFGTNTMLLNVALFYFWVIPLWRILLFLDYVLTKKNNTFGGLGTYVMLVEILVVCTALAAKAYFITASVYMIGGIVYLYLKEENAKSKQETT